MENFVIGALAAGLLAVAFLVLWMRGQRQAGDGLRARLDVAEQRLGVAQEALQKSLREADVLKTELAHEKQRNADKQQMIEEFKQAAKASTLAAASELSSKLLEDHKRENALVKEEIARQREAEARQTAQSLDSLKEKLAATDEISRLTKQQNDVLWRTFSSPASTGRLAEVGLENLLKNMGLKAGQDYSLQHTVRQGEGAGLRPDCVITLPNNRVVVIDCKASKHVLAMAEAEGEAAEAESNERFLATMRQHLSALARKEYEKAILSEELVARRKLRPSHIVNVMYLPSSAAVERIALLDPDLIDRSEKQGIILIGPGMLHGLIALVSKEISDERKLENQEHIIEEVERLLGGLAQTFGHISTVGRNLKTLAGSFAKIGASYNRNVSPKLRTLEKMGLGKQATAKMPPQLEHFELRSLSETIDAESEPVSLIEDNAA